jgi:hypothetical protein
MLVRLSEPVMEVSTTSAEQELVSPGAASKAARGSQAEAGGGGSGFAHHDQAGVALAAQGEKIAVIFDESDRLIGDFLHALRGLGDVESVGDGVDVGELFLHETHAYFGGDQAGGALFDARAGNASAVHRGDYGSDGALGIGRGRRLRRR